MASVVGTQSDVRSHALGRLIGAKAHEIEQRWLRQVQADLAGKPDVEITQLRDGIPDYLAALEHQLTGHVTPDAVGSGTAIWSRIAREHGVTRVRIGFDISQLIHEFVVLRHVVREVGAENGVPPSATDEILTDLIEAAISEAVRAYVEARDYATRRVQAQNIGFITHELRNPVQAAIGAATILRNQAGPQQARALALLERSHHRLIELIDSVLDAERLEAGTVEPRLVEMSEGDLLDRATEAARKEAHDRGLAFELRCDPERRIRLDPDLTSSAIQNLVDNAVKYTDTGRVEVEVEVGEGKPTWSVHVRDTCHGLSSQELATIFEPFRRGSSTTKKGTGLGLSIARRAIEAQGGSIQAESAGSAGCHFWITLPKR